MTDLSPLETLFDVAIGDALPLPDQLKSLYGNLRFPREPLHPYVISNFVTTLDGVVSLNTPGKTGGSEIGGKIQQDRAVMGLLRAVADAVVVGAGTLRAVPRHLWTPQQIYPPLANAYRELRARLGKSESPLNVVVTARGELDLNLPVFSSARVRALIVTTAEGAQRLANRPLPPSTQLSLRGSSGSVSAHDVVDAIAALGRSDLILLEGGPVLLGDFLAERVLNELFLTLAPQIAGRNDTDGRPGLVAGREFAPSNPIWSRLIAVKRADNHLFLRYEFTPGA